MDLDQAQNRWCAFKKTRNSNFHLDMSDDAYMTIQEREKLIDYLFQYIRNLKSRKKMRHFFEGSK